MRLSSEIAPHFHRTFKSKKPHQIDKGGRGSTKTSKNGLKVGYHLLKEENCSVVVLRKYKNTLRNSVYKEIKRALYRLGLREEIDYKASVSPMEIEILTNGNKVYFAGLDNYEKVKGLIDENKPIKIIWFEEVTEFDDEEELQQTTATFVRGNDDWFINLYSYNPPKNKYDWVNLWEDKMSQRDDVLITHSDYRTVPREWLGRMFVEEAERLLKYDEKRYKWIYLGEVIGLEGMIYNPDLIKYKNPEGKILYIDFSIDTGHQTSATVCGAYGYCNDGNWYRLDTYYYSPKEKSVKKSPSELSKDIFNFRVEMLKEYKAYPDRETIDSAEGALRNQFFKDYGLRLNPVNKGKGKEELIDYSHDFIAKGRFFIVPNENNKIFTKEMINYMWKKDSVEKGKPEPDKTEKSLPSNEVYYNTHSKEYSYYYADHSCDDFQYWVKDNLQKLGLRW
jgi:phage terminase large subunit